MLCLKADGQERYQNLGAVAVLKGPEWDDPEIVQFEAVHPRPEVTATYEVRLCQAAASTPMAMCGSEVLSQVSASGDFIVCLASPLGGVHRHFHVKWRVASGWHHISIPDNARRLWCAVQ